MKRLTAGLLSAILLASLLTGCSEKKISSENALFKSQNVLAATDDHQATEEELRLAYSEFVFGIMRNCAQNADGENVLVSPDSILFAMEMAAAGADGNTLDQMIGTMVPGVSNEEGLAFGINHMNEIQNDSVIVANSMWLNSDKDFYEDYVEYVEKNFDAEVSSIRFDDKAAEQINDWVDDNTDGKIHKIIDGVTEADVLILINAITFDASWKKPCGNAYLEDSTFTNGKGDKEDSEYLMSAEKNFVTDDKCIGVIKDYSDDKYAFLMILPNDGNIDINDFMAEMTAEEYWNLWNNKQEESSIIYFPKFKTDYEISLNSILSDMGMKDAFGPDADFGNMTTKDAFISQVIHKTSISVDKYGTEAAAVTMGGATSSSGTIINDKIYFNRPFAYAIVDKDTGLPLFLGTVESIR